MTLRSRARLAWSLLALYVALAGAAVLFGALTADWGVLAWLALFLAFPVVGAVVASRRVGGPFGWICLAVGLGVGVTAVAEGYSLHALHRSRLAPGRGVRRVVRIL
jgi:hypothetical protein